ncbi:MAG: hypothetical protein ACK53B_03080 [Bacteroidota bacterium]
MAKPYNRYTVIRYIIDAPVVGISYLLATRLSSGQSIVVADKQAYLFVLLSLLLWYIAASFTRLYADRRSNKFSEEIIFILYTIILFTILISSASFILGTTIRFSPGFFPYFLLTLFGLLTLTKYIVRKNVHSAIFQGKLLDYVIIFVESGAVL